MQNSTPSVVILISGRGSNLNALIDHAKQTGAYQIRAVISNRPAAAGLALAQSAGLDTAILDHTEYESREAFDSALAGLIDQYQPDWLVLAGFMRVLTAGFVNRYLGRLVNIHPSLLPSFPGLKAWEQALRAGVTQTGCTVHWVNETVDGGAVIRQAKVKVRAGDTAKSLHARIQEAEHRLLPEVVRDLATGKIPWAEDPRRDGGKWKV